MPKKSLKKQKSSINKKGKTIKKGKTKTIKKGKTKTKRKTIKRKSPVKYVLTLTPKHNDPDEEEWMKMIGDLDLPPAPSNLVSNMMLPPKKKVKERTSARQETVKTPEKVSLDQFKDLSPYRVNPPQGSPPLFTNPIFYGAQMTVPPGTTTPQAIAQLNTDSPGIINLHPELHPLEVGRRNRGRRFHTDSDSTLRRILFKDSKMGGKKPHPKKVGGKLKFEDYPEFRPNLTPRQIFTMGSFGGTYFRPIKSKFYNNTLRNKHKKFSFLKGIPENKLTRPFNKYDVKLNKYGKKVGTTLEFWEGKNWINKRDPYGWMQWYCEFYNGRRSSDDKRQIGRWLKLAGPKGRFRKFLVTEILKKGTKKDYNNDKISPAIRQTLQHWGYKLTKKDFDDEIKSRK